MAATRTVIRIATVEAVEDGTINENDGLRIKARLPQDGTILTDNIPWAFPLLPKTLQSIPQVNEAVLIITAELTNSQSQRFYIGPIISQPQFMSYAPYLLNEDETATSLLQGKSTEPITKISNYYLSKGSFPNVEDVALIGRGQEDIRLKYNSSTHISETDITAGIRSDITNSTDPNLRGNVVFNSQDPAYIQVKHGNGLSSQGASFVNVVADKINLMSHNDNEINTNLVDNSTLVKESAFDDVMNKLHPAVKGDKLVELLKLMIGAIKNHVHPWAGMEQCGDWSGFINQLNKFDVNSILSQDIKLS